MMKKWQEVKAANPLSLVFFRLGDFYEMFFDDAKTASAVLGITLTGRDCGMVERAPMCGVPYHAVNSYIKKLVDKGYSVAICEQMTAPARGSMVEREVVKVITAGTYDDENFLDKDKNNFIASIFTSGENASVSWCDVTTGEFFAMETTAADIENIKSMIAPREVIDSNGHYGYAFGSGNAYGYILQYFNILNTKIFDIDKDSRIVNSAGALLHYLMIVGKKPLRNIQKISVIHGREFMILDKTAREHLELLCPIRQPGVKRGSLLWILDDTRTAMGGRELAAWISAPIQDISAINARLDAVETLVNDAGMQRQLRNGLEHISDISRLAGKVAGGNVTPRDLTTISESLKNLENVKTAVKGKGGILGQCRDGIVMLPETTDLIDRAIYTGAPVKTEDGGFIRDGFDKKLDECRNAEKYGKEWLNKLEQTEKTETKIKELKVAYNRVAGYYFEIPTRLSGSLPYRFMRKGSTSTTERYTTKELKEIEDKIINSRENAIAIEIELLTVLRKSVLEKLSEIITNAKNVATLDVLQSFAAVAVANNFSRPSINGDGRLDLKNARHPVVEKVMGLSNYIANGCELHNNTMLITGPNMAGKSTYMRMVAIVVLMAHIGSFVPAEFADIPLTDRIFTRIGASDSLLTGESTFMVEMNEVSNIVHNAKKSSLILLDEVGRGTGTSDGLALASAVITYLTDKIGANIMFATHFHELTDLSKTNPRIKNYKVLTEQIGGEIVFLHRLESGIEQNSFGIDVARLAGLPSEIIDNARRLLK